MKNMIYPGYPQARFRLPDGAPIPDPIPDGVWNAGGKNSDDSWTMNPTLPSSSEAAIWRTEGYATDSLNRPLHPHLSRMIREVGVYAGRGAYWHFGPNFTADPVVIARDQVLLIKRRDTGIWALPGGFRDEIDGQLEPPAQTAARELREETYLKLRPENARWIGHLVCDDLRATAHAWCETDGFLWQIPAPIIAKAGDDAAAARWWPVAKLPEEMMSSHLELIRRGAK
jgi:ADP-ribose pyrophosphatase YjhB (NUDIX family)